ncbi:MAG TPA: hypothetical protein VK192_12450 [Sphingomicrobium sp.]|nr:hypothetical protein [Sphingomicrobium sp.]
MPPQFGPSSHSRRLPHRIDERLRAISTNGFISARPELVGVYRFGGHFLGIQPRRLVVAYAGLFERNH